jgi:hypothetical protein
MKNLRAKHEMNTFRCFFFVIFLWMMGVMPTSYCFVVVVVVVKHPSSSSFYSRRATTTFLGSNPTSTTSNTKAADEDAPAGIAGAEFFGGNKQKAEFYDPEAEAQAAVEQQIDTDEQQKTYDRFMDTMAFPDELARSLAQDLQRQINQRIAVWMGEEDDTQMDEMSFDTKKTTNQVSYANDCRWQTSLPVSAKNPLLELQKNDGTAASFYRQMALAITSASTTVASSSSSQDNYDERMFTMQLRFELSVLWPTIWEPRVMLTGTSKLIILHNDNENKNGTNNYNIVSQIDTFDENWMDSVRKQILPRFWDLYHIGMTPAAELPHQTRIAKPGNLLLNNNYDVVEIPPRWYLETQIPSGNREDGDASYIPNPAFSCVIKTMGPMKQSFTPVSGIRIDILRSSSSSQQSIRFQIPLAVEYAAQTSWILPESGQYVFYSHTQRIATIPCGCDPQDPVQIPKLRQTLYEAVIRDGKYRPKMTNVVGDGTNGSSSRPIFFYYNDVAKACYTHEGLGMAVYEWRPSFTQPNRIGLELECDE